MQIQHFLLLIHGYRYLRSNKFVPTIAAKLSSVSQISNENANGNIVTPISAKTNAPFGVKGIYIYILIFLFI